MLELNIDEPQVDDMWFTKKYLINRNLLDSQKTCCKMFSANAEARKIQSLGLSQI